MNAPVSRPPSTIPAARAPLRRIAVATTVEVGLLVGAYLLLAHWLAGGQTIATLLAGGGANLGYLLLAGAFVLLRFVVVLVLPAFVAYRAVRFGFAWLRDRDEGRRRAL